ncbi:uncharacterized protein [Gossypium hirsutum]|uniref:Uncharacterized protein n=1 Tax=Gossypium hirsutum TaxID=3635 RepID=A0ABM2YV25_GOSHI|nr:uncharacterized protein LOC121207907 [Gossypium hirsutum]
MDVCKYCRIKLDFLFLLYTNQCISNFLNLYEWKFWKMIGMDDDWIAVSVYAILLLVPLFPLMKLYNDGISRVSVHQLGPIKKFSMEISGLCFFAIISNFYVEDVNYSYGFISLITIFPRIIMVLGFDIFDISVRDTLMEVALQVIMINLRRNEFIVCVTNLGLLIAFIIHRFRCIHLQPSHAKAKAKATVKAKATATATMTTTTTTTTAKIATTTMTMTTTIKMAKGETMLNGHKLILNEQQELRRSTRYKHFSYSSPLYLQ